MEMQHNNKKGYAARITPRFFGGAEEDRTPDLLNAIQALSQLSYSPTVNLINERVELTQGFTDCQYIFLDICQPLI